MPVKIVETNIDGTSYEHETMSVGELIEALLKLNPKDPIRAEFDAGCASGDIKGIERRDDDREYDIIIE